MRKLIYFIFLATILSCSDNPMPKPSAYYRIDLKKRSYQFWDSDCPYRFKKSSIATIQKSKLEGKSCYWDLHYPDYNATIYLSYLPVNGDLKSLVDQEYALREKHNVFSTGVTERVFQNLEKKVSAMVFQVKGSKAATPLQFFITDSTQHFFRGTLYFYNTPNNDSLAPVIEYLEQDMDSLIESFEWK